MKKKEGVAKNTISISNFSLVAMRKREGYPSALARLIHQAREKEKLSLNALGKLGFPKLVIWRLENIDKPVYGPKKLFQLADILNVPKVDIMICYLRDNINRNSANFNLARVPFTSAKLIFLLSAVKGLFPGQLARKVGFQKKKIYQFMNGSRLVNKKELDALLTCLDADEDDSRIIRKAWNREHKKILEKKRRERIRIYEELIDGFPMEKLKPREREFLRLHLRENWNFSRIGRKKSLSRERVRQIVTKTLAMINQWRKGQK